MGNIYIALIGDVIRSREVADRGELQHKLRHALAVANEGFSQDIASNLVLTAGDEFQALLFKPGKVLQILSAVRSLVFPHELRFGLGIGELETELRPEAIGMDGPCLHRAREAIERAATRATPVEAAVDIECTAFHIYSLLYGQMRNRWTERQRQVVDLAQRGLEGKEIARLLNVSQSAISQHLRAAGYDAVSKASAYWMNELKKAFGRMQSNRG